MPVSGWVYLVLVIVVIALAWSVDTLLKTQRKLGRLVATLSEALKWRTEEMEALNLRLAERATEAEVFRSQVRAMADYIRDQGIAQPVLAYGTNSDGQQIVFDQNYVIREEP